MVSSKKSVHIAPEVVDSAEAFMEMFVTEARLRQGWEEVCRKGNTEEEKDATQDLQKIGTRASSSSGSPHQPSMGCTTALEKKKLSVLRAWLWLLLALSVGR